MCLALSVLLLSAQTEYTADGSHSALEEEIRWLTNRGRFDTASENAARGTAYADVPASAGPLAPHESLSRAARRHSEDMAKNNLFQHDTVPGSAYYDPATHPRPWDRMRAEGYSGNRSGENIAAGYASAEAAYLGWWTSSGHRRNLCNAEFREIGNGYFFWQSSTYRRYYTMNLAGSSTTHFFTGTLFHDINGNGAYNQNEGIAGIRVTLRVNGTPHTHFDLSTEVGSFAVPIQSIPAGATVEVFLANTSDAQTQLSIPRDYHTLTAIALDVHEEQSVGSFIQTPGARNLGFRDLTPPPPPVSAPVLALSMTGPYLQIGWRSQVGEGYLLQVTSDLVLWTDLAPGPQPGTGAEMTWTDPAPLTPPGFGFYRVLVTAL